MTTIDKHILVQDGYQVTAKFTTPILGSQPSQSVAVEWVRARSIDRKAVELRKQGLSAADAKIEAERVVNESMNITEEEREGSEVQVTVFHKDGNGVHLMDYQLKGALKEATKQLDFRVPGKRAADVSAQRFVAGGVWVYPLHAQHGRNIYFYRDGDFIPEPDTVFDRIKRVDTMQGPRTSIAASEIINPPATIQFIVTVLMGFPITEEQVHQMLAYMSFQGLGQWRGAGHGRVECDVTRLTRNETISVLRS